MCRKIPNLCRMVHSAVAVIVFVGQFDVDAAEKVDPVNEKITAVFSKADANADGQVTLEEFLTVSGATDVSRRNFLLFDWNKDGQLMLEEFASVPYLVAGVERGPIPDPFNALVDRFVADLDQSFGKWDERPNVEINANQFVESMAKAFQAKQIPFDHRTIDSNKNGSISRAEARQFTEIQLSVRNGAGSLLQRPNGQMVNYALYLYIDVNRNGLLEKSEFVERSYPAGKAEAEAEFDVANADGNGHLTVEEFGKVGGRCLDDPVVQFCHMDTNLDTFVSPEELTAGTVEWKKSLTTFVFPGFDVDRDGKLSLSEYQFTQQANAVAQWALDYEDSDGDGVLSFAEFRHDPAAYAPFDQLQFPLLRYLYFQRFDVNGDGKLDSKEYHFKRKVPDEFFVMNEDGTGWKSLLKFQDHHACGSVAVSPNGKSIAFDSWPESQQSGSAIYTMELEELKPRQLCSGMMPTWSKDGLFLTCSRNEQPYGIWLIDVENEKWEHVCPGWGAQWSPDGRRIAFYQGKQLKTFDIAADDYETILDAKTNPYQQLFWNMCWSPDSKRLCMKCSKADGTFEIASVNMSPDKPDIKVHLSTKLSISADFAWHPKGDRIVFAMQCVERGFVQLYEFDPNKSDPPWLVKGQDETRNNTDCCWSPDGKLLYIVSGDF